MAAFIVVGLPPSPTALRAKVVSAYADTHLQLSETAWLVADKGVTTQQVAIKLGINVGGMNGFVSKVESYFGLAPPNTWEWLKLRAPEP
jgi:hypothetical protein